MCMKIENTLQKTDFKMRMDYNIAALYKSRTSEYTLRYG
jgi:hypothetical protein